jgi:malate dehydrogenase (oxaloacetate-decarboxylating)(NADP+)
MFIRTLSVSTSFLCYKRHFVFTYARPSRQNATLRGNESTSHRVEPILVEKTGLALLHDPLYNKGTAWPPEERDRLGIRGLVPPAVLTMQAQIQRVMGRYNKIQDPLDKYEFLTSLQDRNETLFYRLLIDNIHSMAPIVYTPTVGLACLKFSSLYRRARGMYFSVNDRGQMHAMVYNWPAKNVDVIVVTDGSRVLGLGDLGCQGMGISIGKLSLYVAGGGIHPQRTLPVCIDAGTNNERLLNDPVYIGIRRPRIKGEEYYSLIDEFMRAVNRRWPNVLVQFEDFSNENAMPILEKYRYKYLCFNDDIQGTGAVALSGVLSALRIRGSSMEDLAKERIVVVGAGSAGTGVANSLAWTMITELGVPAEQAFANFWMVDKDGLLGQGRSNVPTAQMRYVRHDTPDRLPLLEVIKKAKPTILLGLTGVHGIFTEEIIKEMYKHCKQPIIFPLSNPTANAECTAEQAYLWTDGNAIVATGSPFDPVQVNGQWKYPSQGNNMYIFPGVGLAAVACKVKRISYRMLNRAGIALSKTLSQEEVSKGIVYPDISRIREVSLAVALADLLCSRTNGLPRRPRGD